MPGSIPWRGAAAGLAAAVLFGVTTPVAKRLLLPGSGPFLLAGLLYLGAGLGLSLAAPFRRPGRESRLRREDLPRLAGMALAGGVLGPILLLAGLARLTGAQASLLLNLEAPLTILLAVGAFGESLSPREILGAAAVVVGAAALAGGGGGAPGLAGALLVAGACAAWALDNNLGRALSLRDPVAVTRVKALAAGAVNTAVALALGERPPAALPVAVALATGLLGYGLSIVLHLLAMREVGAARQAAYFATAPFVGAVAAVPLLGERLGARELAAGAVMAAGAALLVRARHGHRHEHPAFSHDHAHRHDAHHDHAHSGAPAEPHSHPHPPLAHDHPHLPDAHHRHRH